jgi:hypothetical protein
MRGISRFLLLYTLHCIAWQDDDYISPLAPAMQLRVQLACCAEGGETGNRVRLATVRVRVICRCYRCTILYGKENELTWRVTGMTMMGMIDDDVMMEMHVAYDM